MEDKNILDVVMNYKNTWMDEEIGAFVRKALTEDKTEEDLLKELGLNRRRP